MAKIKDISSESFEVIRLINKDKLFKKVKPYNYENYKVFYCITHNNSSN